MADRYVLEPFAEERMATQGIGDRTAAALSQAISLKRIADALEGVTDHAYNLPAIRTRAE